MTFRKLFETLALAVASPAVLTFAAGPALAQPAAARPSDFKTNADAIVTSAYPADGPGAAVIVMRRGQTIYSVGRGFADVERSRPLSADTVFLLGSITKQFTAAVVLQLVDEGRMSLDDPISRFFPDHPQPGARATVRQLLNHASGLQDYTKIPGWVGKNRSRPFTTAQLIAVARDLPAKSEPGTAWEYNNGGYVMLGAIVEKVTGKAWHAAVAERISRPLGLRTIAYDVSGGGAATARGYSEEQGQQQLVERSHMSVPHAAGGLTGSPADLAKWAQALHHGRVVSPALYQEMIRPARLADGSTEPYGFGLRLQELRGRKALVHGGAIAGFATASAYFPAEDVFVAVFANSDDPTTPPSTVVQQLGALALGAPIPTFRRAEIDPRSIESLFGRYSAKSGPERRFFSRGGKLYIARGDEEQEIIPAGQDRFFLASPGLTWFRFARQGDGAHTLEINRPDAAAAERSARLGAIPANAAIIVAPAVLQSYVGTFPTDAGSPAIVAMGADGWLTIQLNSPPLPMRPVSQTEFMVDRAKSRVIFHPENGKVDRLTIRRGARELRGLRRP